MTAIPSASVKRLQARAFSNREHFEGLQASLLARGLTLTASRKGDYSNDSGFVQALALVAAANRPQAIGCAHDAMAMGAISATRRLNLEKLQDLATIGFDDIPAPAWEPYSLTTIANPVVQTARLTMELL